MAEPLAGGELVDPHGGAADLAARRLRMVSGRALPDDPLRTLRAVRFAVELGFEIEPATGRGGARARAARSRDVSPERVFAELKRVVAAPRVRDGLELMEETGLLAAVLPELEALRGVEQSVYHHADVLGHTLEVLDAVVAMEADPAAVGLGGELAAPVAALLAEPLANELTRGTALRFAALLHDAAKPQTRDELPGGRVTFVGHDSEGAELARDVLRRLRASERLAGYVADADRATTSTSASSSTSGRSRAATIWRYLAATAPHSADVTLLTVADRLATRGRKAEPGDRRAPRARARGARARLRAARGGPAAAARPRRRARRRARHPRPARSSASCCARSRRTATPARSARARRPSPRARELLAPAARGAEPPALAAASRTSASHSTAASRTVS